MLIAYIWSLDRLISWYDGYHLFEMGLGQTSDLVIYVEKIDAFYPVEVWASHLVLETVLEEP
jgi:hypothetical protein